jgi:DNA (cytosine-5)-methyltransferase 1
VSAGLRDAGFDVIGVDINPQPNYPARFIQADIMTMSSHDFSVLCAGVDFIWASPPCQAFTAYKRRGGHVRPRENLIPRVREMLQLTGIPYAIENVVGAPLQDAVVLCGSMFNLDVRRHRLIETSFPMLAPACQHEKQTPRFAPATNRKNKRSTVEVGVWRIPLDVQQRAMGIDWMTREELSQAIPPAYAAFVGRRGLGAA